MDNIFTKQSSTSQKITNLRFLAEVCSLLLPICSEVTAATLEPLSNGSTKLVLEVKPKASFMPSETSKPSSTSSTRPAINSEPAPLTQVLCFRLLEPLVKLLDLYRSQNHVRGTCPTSLLDQNFVAYLNSVEQVVGCLDFGLSVASQELASLRSQFKLLCHWARK